MKEDYPWVRSVSAKKRKEKVFLFPSNVSKLNIEVKRIAKIPYPNEYLEEDVMLVEDEACPSAANQGVSDDESEDVSEDETEEVVQDRIRKKKRSFKREFPFLIMLILKQFFLIFGRG